MVGGAAGRRASLLGRGRVRTEALRGGGCCRSPETVREQAVCFLVGGNRLRRDGGLLFRGEAGSGRSFRGAVVAAVPRKRSGNRRCVSWSKGTGCGGTAGFSFGERPARAEVSAGQWLLPFLGNGPGTGGVFLGRRGRAAAGRRASFSGRGGFGHVSRRHRYSLLTPAACVSAPRRLPPRCLSSSHHPLLPAPPPLLTRRTSCQPPRRLCPRRLCPRRLCPRRLLPPPPLLATPVAVCLPAACRFSPPVITRRPPLPPAATARRLPPSSFPCLSSSAVACTPAASHPPLPPAATVACHPRYSPQSATTRCLPFPPPCAGRADRWAAAAPRVVGRGAMRRRREVLRNNLENRKILPIFVSVKYRGSGLSRPGFLFFIGLSFLWQKRLSI